MSITINGSGTITGVSVGGLPDGVVDEGTLAADSVTDAKLSLAANDAEIKTALNATGSAPIYAVRAWVNFDGSTNTGGSCTVRASGNVSSVTDNGTANYTINFASALPDANYTCASMQGHNTAAGAARAVVYDQDNTKSTTALQIRTVFDWVNYYDLNEVYVAIIR